MDENKDTTRYSPTEFAKMVDVCDRTLRNWEKQGKIVPNRDSAGRPYYTQAHYEEYLSRGMIKIDSTQYNVTYTPGQFAEIIGVGQTTLWVWNNNGTLPARRDHDGNRYYTDADYAECINRNLMKKKTDETGPHATNGFTRDTKFVTSDGIRRFQDFKDGEAVTVLAKDGHWREATVHKCGKRTMFDIVFQAARSNKIVSCTADHSWILPNGAYTADLKTGYAIMELPDIADELEPMTKNDIDMWCFGFIIGDGSDRRNKYEHRLRLELCGDKKKYIDRFLKAGYAIAGTAHDNNQVLFKQTDMSKQSFLDGHAWKYMSKRGKQMLFMGYYAADGCRRSNTASTTDERIVKMILEISAIAGYHVSSYNVKEHIETNYTKDMTKHIIYFRKHQIKSHRWNTAQIKKHPNNPCEAWCIEEPVTHSFTLAGGMVTGDCSPIRPERT